jgi:hypothetical protein
MCLDKQQQQQQQQQQEGPAAVFLGRPAKTAVAWVSSSMSAAASRRISDDMHVSL